MWAGNPLSRGVSPMRSWGLRGSGEELLLRRRVRFDLAGLSRPGSATTRTAYLVAPETSCTPGRDTVHFRLVDTDAVLTAFNTQLRQAGHEWDGPVARAVADDPNDWSGVVWSDLDESNADAVIAR